jgi:prophage tail gpP-like protein
MADQVQLLVGGRAYSGWKSVTVTRAMDAATGSFSLGLVERWAGQDEPWPIVPGDECEVRLGSDTVITGYVDVWRPSFSKDEHAITVQGRDKSADMVDCSAVHSPDEWRDLDVLALAKILARPFGVKVRADVQVGERFRVVKLQQGETAFEALDRHCRMRKLLLMPDGLGGLLITRAGAEQAETVLEQGVNIKSASGSIDMSQRFSSYTVRAQAGWSAETDVETESLIEAVATDPGVGRRRPMLLVAEAGGTTAAAKERATWEANVRIGRAASVDVVVAGWRQRPGGALWRPNLQVDVRSSWLRMAGTMLVRQVTYAMDKDGGQVAQLALVSPQAFAPEPPAPETAESNPWASELDENEWPGFPAAGGG